MYACVQMDAIPFLCKRRTIHPILAVNNTSLCTDQLWQAKVHKHSLEFSFSK